MPDLARDDECIGAGSGLDWAVGRLLGLRTPCRETRVEPLRVRASERQKLERRPGEIGEVDLDPDIRVAGHLGVDTVREFLRVLLGHRIGDEVSPAASDSAPFRRESLCKNDGVLPVGQVDDDVPVVRPFELGLRTSAASRAVYSASSSCRVAGRGIEASFHDSSTGASA